MKTRCAPFNETTEELHIMKIGTIGIAASVLALGLASYTIPSKAQGPLYDRVNVNLPYSVTIGDRTLPPGDYVIQQLRDLGGGSRVLLIYSDSGMKFETSAMTIPALKLDTPEDTKVILHHFGPDYYFDKVWIQGKNYGYEFPLPDSVKARERERMEPLSVAANYSSVPADTATTTSQTTGAATNNQTSAAATNTQTSAAATNTQTSPAATNNQTSAAATNQNTMAQTTTAPTTMAQNTAPSTTMTPTTTRSTVENGNNSANREMPHTSAGWLMMLLSGGALSGAGLKLRRKQ